MEAGARGMPIVPGTCALPTLRHADHVMMGVMQARQGAGVHHLITSSSQQPGRRPSPVQDGR